MPGLAPPIEAPQPGQRVSVTCGPLRIAARFPPGLATGRTRGWLDAPDLPANVEGVIETGHVPAIETLTFLRLDPDGCRFETPLGLGDVDFTTGTAQFRIPDTQDLRVRSRATVEVLLATAYAQVLLRGGMWLHAACLMLQGRAYVVCGHSTAGKSTLAMRFPDAWLHDELTFVVPGPRGWQVWRQAEWRGTREERPWLLELGGLLALGPDRTQTKVEPLPGNEGLTRVLACAYHAGGQATPRLFDGALALTADWPVRQLSHCLADSPDVVAQRIVEGCGG